MRRYRFAACVVFTVFFVLFSCSSRSWRFPNKVDGYRLVKLIKGKRAVEEINRLHGKKINVLKAAIAVYAGDGKSAVIWVSRAPSEKEALAQTEAMITRMEKRSPFYGFEVRKVGCLTVYHFKGLGKEHYLFYRKGDVFWISAPSGDGIKFLKLFATAACPLTP